MSAPKAQNGSHSASSTGHRNAPPAVSSNPVRNTSNVVPIPHNHRPSGALAPSSAARKPAAATPHGGQPVHTQWPASSSRLHDPKFKQHESSAAQILMQLKDETKKYYDRLGKTDPEVRYGGRFLHNREHIGKQRLFQVAQSAPKGAHLHIHLNACLGPAFLLELAASDELKHNMYISVDLQDPKKVAAMRMGRSEAKDKADKINQPAPKIKNAYKEPLTAANIGTANFQFHFLPYGWDTTCSLFSPEYRGRVEATEKAEDKTYDVMKFTDFLSVFDKAITADSGLKTYNGRLPNRCMNWLIKRLVFQKEEVVFSEHKTDNSKKVEPSAVKRQWDLFNTRTQMMKGLFLAETAYRKYLQALFSSFDKDHIQYAELRPNFMKANSVICTSKADRIPIPGKPGAFSYDPVKMMDNRAIMDMIIDEFQSWQAAHPKATFKSMKVIMCTPRSRPYPIKFIEATMQECYEMKQEAKYKDWIAGFDFVGPELDGRTLKELKPQFDMWKAKYAAVKLKWILHCGESVYDRDGNLKFALDELNPHRLAHGYAIQNAPLDKTARAKLQKLCIETCPDSNEDLGLAYDASCTAVYPLMKEGIPCSVSCDNPTLFNSTLSHEFYQVMVGKDDFGLREWKKLMMDSIKHSVWNSEADRAKVWNEWEGQYVKFVHSIVQDFSPKRGS